MRNRFISKREDARNRAAERRAIASTFPMLTISPCPRVASDTRRNSLVSNYDAIGSGTNPNIREHKTKGATPVVELMARANASLEASRKPLVRTYKRFALA